MFRRCTFGFREQIKLESSVDMTLPVLGCGNNGKHNAGKIISLRAKTILHTVSTQDAEEVSVFCQIYVCNVCVNPLKLKESRLSINEFKSTLTF